MNQSYTLAITLCHNSRLSLSHGYHFFPKSCLSPLQCFSLHLPHGLSVGFPGERLYPNDLVGLAQDAWNSCVVCIGRGVMASITDDPLK